MVRGSCLLSQLVPAWSSSHIVIMVFLLSAFTAALTAFSMFESPLAVPLAEKLRSLSPGARDVLKRTTPAAPHFVAYDDAWVYPFPAPSSLLGFNTYAIAFWLSYGAADMAQGWVELTDSQRTSYLQEYNAAGISLIVSAFGSTDTPTTSGMNPITTANDLAAWVLQYSLQGVDVDYEDFAAFDYGGGSAEAWLISFTQQLRTQLPQGQYIITHAPVAPWFSPSNWTGGGYLAVDKSVGSLIDWYNVQFYNQGASEYTTCSGLLTASTSQWPETALFQIAANGASLDKLVIGKPGTTSDAGSGYMSASTLASCAAEAHSSGWDGGIMVWQYPDVGSSWIITVRGSVWPVSGSPPPTPTTTTTSAQQPTTSKTTTTTTTTSTTTTTTSKTTTTTSKSTTTTSSLPTTTAPSGSGNCAGVSAWASNVAYVSGNKVTYNGDLWTADQWNQDEVPGGLSGAWNNDGACT